MDRNMKVWAAAKDEHERMVHKGRVQEAALLQDKMAQLKYKAAEAGHAKKFLEGEVVRLEARREIDVENLHRVSAELARRNSALRTCAARPECPTEEIRSHSGTAHKIYSPPIQM